MPPNPKIKGWDSPLCLKQSIQSPLYGQRDSFHHRIDPLQSHIRMSSTVIGAPTKPDDDTPLTEILRAAGDGNNHLVQSSRIPIKSVMVEEEITYAQLGDFDTKGFKEVFNLKLGPTMKILKAAKQYNTSKPKKFLTSPGESDRKMPAADSSATMWGAPFHSVLHPDHSTTTVAMNIPNVPPPDHSTTTVAMKKPNDSYDDLGIDQSKLGDELKQLREIMTKMLPDTKDTSKDNEKIDEKTTELIRQFKFLDNESLLTNSLKKYKMSRDWYNNRFNNTWNEDDPRVIVQRFTEFCTQSFLTGDIMASTCKNKLTTCKFLLLRQGKMVNDSATALLDTAISYWSNTMKNRIQGGQENANPNITEDDSLHIIGTIMKIYPDGIPNNIFQEILKLLFTQRVGRRMDEIHWIAIGSLVYLMEPVEGKGPNCYDRSITIEGVVVKGKGSVDNLTLRFYENTGYGIVKNTVLWFLCYCQRRGMIRSAHDVYHNKETFLNDPNRFETADELRKKVELGSKMSEQSLRQDIDLLDFSTNDNNKKKKTSRKKTIQNLLSAVRMLDATEDENGRSKEKMWVTCTTNDNLLTNIRYDHVNSRSFSMFGQKVGYTPHKLCRLGLTGCRAGHRTDVGDNTVGGLDTDSYLNQVMGHSGSVGHDYYANHNALRKQYGSNLLQRGMDPELVHRVIKNHAHPAAYEIPTFFDKNVTIYNTLDKLPR